MNDKDQPAHGTQGPHRELHTDRPTEVVPLHLTVHPGEVGAVVTRPEAVIGRHSRADIRLAFPEVSRRHARLTFEKGQWRIIDLDSLNGIFINGERMHDAVLYDGDEVRIGACGFTVDKGTPAGAVAPRQSDHEIKVLKRIVEVMPRQAG